MLDNTVLDNKAMSNSSASRDPLALAPAAVDLRREDDGSLTLRSPQPLAPYPASLGERLRHWASAAAERTFFAEHDAEAEDGWRRLSWGEALSRVESLAQALLDHGLGPERPLILLSDNGIDHALLQLAAMHVGVPAAPISPAYSLMSGDHARLRALLELTTPGMVYAKDGDAFAAALVHVPVEVPIVLSTGALAGRETWRIDALCATSPTSAVAAAFDTVGPDTVAKVLFTSGSTGTPKGVLNTQRMLCSNQQAIAQMWPFLAARPPVLVDWLPWSHTFGGNHNFNLVLYHGGTLYIDPGKPLPERIAATVDSLRAVSPTLYFNVPRGFDALLPFLEREADLAARFFRRLDVIFYAGAALPQNLWQRLVALAAKTGNRRVLLTTAWGATETSPLATSAHYPIARAGIIGLPAPGTTIRLVPSGDKHEVRVHGPNVSPGYWRRDDLTREAFDARGYFRTGDAGRLADPDRPERGLVFDGRTAESFKLTSGTWVHAGALRLAVIAAGEPVIQDAVVTGHDRDAVGLLVFPSLAGCRQLCADDQAQLASLVTRPEVHTALRAGLATHNRGQTGSSRRIARVLLMGEPPAIDAGEITDKGYINQGAVLRRRADLVARLYAGNGDDVLVLDDDPRGA